MVHVWRTGMCLHCTLSTYCVQCYGARVTYRHVSALYFIHVLCSVLWCTCDVPACVCIVLYPRIVFSVKVHVWCTGMCLHCTLSTYCVQCYSASARVTYRHVSALYFIHVLCSVLWCTCDVPACVCIVFYPRIVFNVMVHVWRTGMCLHCTLSTYCVQCYSARVTYRHVSALYFIHVLCSVLWCTCDVPACVCIVLYPRIVFSVIVHVWRTGMCLHYTLSTYCVQCYSARVTYRHVSALYFIHVLCSVLWCTCDVPEGVCIVLYPRIVISVIVHVWRTGMCLHCTLSTYCVQCYSARVTYRNVSALYFIHVLCSVLWCTCDVPACVCIVLYPRIVFSVIVHVWRTGMFVCSVLYPRIVFSVIVHVWRTGMCLHCTLSTYCVQCYSARVTYRHVCLHCILSTYCVQCYSARVTYRHVSALYFIHVLCSVL